MNATTTIGRGDAGLSDAYCALILSYNHWRDTVACIESLLRTEVPPELIIVCDNASRDGSLELLRDWAHQSGQLPCVCLTRTQLVSMPDADLPRSGILLLDNQANLGYAGGNNIGLNVALSIGFGYVWLLNNDTIVAAKAPSALLKHMNEHRRCGLCGTLTRYMDDPEVLQCYGGGWYSRIWGLGGLWGDGDRLPLGRVPTPPYAPLDYVNGASTFIRREFLATVGFMEEAYFLYCEEIDWAQRAKGRFTLDFEPAAEILHKEGLATGASNKRGLGRCVRSSLRLVRSRLLFARKFHPWLLPSVALGQVFALLRKLLARLKRHCQR